MAFNSLNNKIEYIKRGYQHLGFRALFKKAIYDRTEEMISETNLNDKVNVSYKEKLEIQKIEKQDMDILIDKYKQSGFFEDDPTDHVKQYFANDCKCYIALINQNIIGHIWWGNNQMNFDFDDLDLKSIQHEITMKDDDVYLWDFFIIPKERPGGYAIEFLSKVMSDLKSLGYNRAIGFVPDTPNFRPAKWIYSLFGAKEIKRIINRRILSFFMFKNKRFYFDRNMIHWLFFLDDGTTP